MTWEFLFVGPQNQLLSWRGGGEPCFSSLTDSSATTYMTNPQISVFQLV